MARHFRINRRADRGFRDAERDTESLKRRIGTFRSNSGYLSGRRFEPAANVAVNNCVTSSIAEIVTRRNLWFCRAFCCCEIGFALRVRSSNLGKPRRWLLVACSIIPV